MSIDNRGNSQNNTNKNFYSIEGNTNHETAYILPEQYCNVDNQEAIEQALKSPQTRIPKALQPYYLDYQNKHQRQFLKRVNLIGQLTFLSYFFVDWFLLPEIATLSATMRLILVIMTLSINWFVFHYSKNIKILESLLPLYGALAAGLWIELLLVAHRPLVSSYIYASIIFILLGNLSIQVSFTTSVWTSLLSSVVIYQGVLRLFGSQEIILFSLTYIPVFLLSIYISWNNTLNSKRTFLRLLLNDWNYYALTELAHTDELTQLNNRRQFMQVAEQTIRKWPKYNLACLLMFDIDFFKKINDSYGHDVGDEVLRILSEITRKEMRSTDMLARFGGEEFIALLPNTTLDDTVTLANRLCKKIENHQVNIQDKFFFHFTVSIGVSQLQPQQNDLNVLIKNADIALYQAKKNGRNQVAVYTCES